MESSMLSEFYQRYQREIFLYLFSLCKSESLAEDLLQETFLKATLSLPNGHTNVRAWLYLVARNLYFDQQKHERTTDLPPSLKCVDAEKDPLKHLLQDEQSRILYTALSSLEERKREILQLQYFGGFSQREIGAILHIKPDYVRVLAHRAKADLRKWMEEHDYDLS